MKVKALFKQSTVKGGVAQLTFEIITDATNAFDVIQLSGKNVVLDVEDEQQSIDFNTGEVY